MAEYLIQGETLDAIADAIHAKSGAPTPMTPAEMVTEINGIPSGAAITDGIVFNARNGNGYATQVDFYGTQVYRAQFWNRTISDGTWIYLQSINFKDAVTAVQDNAFSRCNALQFIDLSTVETIGVSAFMDCKSLASLNLQNLTALSGYAFSNCTSLETIIAPKNRNWLGRALLSGCTALQIAELGGVGYGVTGISSETFNNCAQSGLTITVFTTGSYADTAVTNIRNGATNATIIIKASENTTYNGTSYAAGDTILTSTP